MAKGKYAKWLEADNLLLLQAWARRGLSDEQIAHNMGISVATLYNYKKTHLEILEALKKGKDVVNVEVENALLKRAMGYEYTETTREGGVVTKVVTKHVAPDTTAQIFWLKNKMPQDYRDKKELEVTGNLSITDALQKARKRVKQHESTADRND